ncbi:MAG: hypothetical protein E7624_05235 [Ruminococcaceae bacterium]|nr:hypothetical protein [Oscillospiraceae bacterium]
MKVRTRLFCTVLSVLLLCGALCLPAFAARTAITTVIATSNLDEVAVLYGRTQKLNFTVEEGAPTRFNQSWVTCWEKYDEESGKWENYSGCFYPGKYRVFAQLRIDGENAKTYELAKTVTCTVDGEAWVLEPVSQHGDFSCVFATSPEIVIADDPNIVEPVVVEHAYFTMTGYVAGQDFSDIAFYPHLGSEDKIDIVQVPVFVDMTDANGDGISDSIDTESMTYTPAEGAIKENTEYMMHFSFRAKEGYDLYELEPKNVHLPCKKAIAPGVDFAGGYDAESGIYSVTMLLLPSVTTLSFTESPTDPVGYYRGEDGSIELSFLTNGAVDKYQIAYYDEEYEDWNVYSNAFTTSFTFYYVGEAQTALYHIEAIKDGNTVATSEPFRITWKEMKPVTLPIRIDASVAAGSKTPVDLTELYPESEQYEFVSEGEITLNRFLDGETGDPVTQFENGKEYGYMVSVAAKPGYYFENRKSFWGTPDSVRIYGIGWEQVMNVKIGSDTQFDAVFTFTYNEETGIPAEPEKLLNELIFDASALVGVTTPARIPDEIFAHEALTLCGAECDCTKLEDEVKATLDAWLQVGEGTPPTPANAFLLRKAYTYMLAFHVAEGWSVPGVLSDFDFVLSGTGLEAVDVIYQPELQMLAVRLGFLCENENGIPAGAHSCIKNAVAEKSPGCTEDGVAAHYTCTCGKSYTDKWGMHEVADPATLKLAATGHTFAAAWQSDAAGHWHVCDCGAQSEKLAHTFADDACTACGALAAKSEEGLPTGAIVAIAIGAVVLVVGGGFCVYWFLLRKKKQTNV